MEAQKSLREGAKDQLNPLDEFILSDFSNNLTTDVQNKECEAEGGECWIAH